MKRLDEVMKETGAAVSDELMDGPTAIVVGSGDPTEAAKILKAFHGETALSVAKGGMLGARAVSAADVAAMASLPAREALLSRFVGTCAAPMSGLAGVLRGKLLSLLYVLRAVEDSRNGSD